MSLNFSFSLVANWLFLQKYELAWLIQCSSQMQEHPEAELLFPAI
jgi:hypothetical protein